MVEHDLLSEDDFFEQLKKEKRQPKAPAEEVKEEKEEEISSEESLEPDLFEIEEEAPPKIEEEAPVAEPSGLEEEEEEIQPEVGAEPLIEPHPFEEERFASYEEDMLGAVERPHAVEEEPQAPPAEEPAFQPEKPKAKIYVPEDKVEDEKLPGLSKKPVIIWSVLVLALIVGVFVIYNIFFTGQSKEAVQKPPEEQKPAQESAPPVEDPMLIKQKDYLAQVAAQNKQRLKAMGAIFTNAQKNKVQIASMLLYGNELSVEVFGKNRDQLARALMDIRASLNNAGLKVVAADVRPGDGITNVLSFKLPQNGGSGASGGIEAKLTSVNETSQWLSMLGQQFSVKLSPVKELSSQQAQFNLSQHKIQFAVKGSYDNCIRFLQALGQSNRNVRLYKVVFSSLDQKSFSKSKYQANIIAELYL